MRHFVLSTLLFLPYSVFAQTKKVEGSAGSFKNYSTQFNRTHFTVERNDGYAIVNLDGTTVSSGIKVPTVGFTRELSIHYGVFFAKEGDNIVLKNLSGKTIGQGKYKEILPFKTDNTVVEVQGAPGTMVLAYIDTTGKEIVRFDAKKYSAIVPNNGRSLAFLDLGNFLPYSEGLTPIKSHIAKKHGYIDKTLKLVIPVTFKEAAPFSEGLAAVQNDDGNWGYINKTGKLVIPYTYSRSPSRFSSGLAKVENKDGKFGYINKENKVIIQPKYEYATHFYKGYALVREEYGKPSLLIDSIGNTIASFDKNISFIDNYKPAAGISGRDRPEFPFYISETLQQLVDGGKGIFTKGLSYGLVDNKGKIVLDFKYTYLADFHDDKMFAYKTAFINNSTQHEYGIINSKGELVVHIVRSEF